MKENLNIIEPLFEKAEEFGKTSLELFKLKAVDRTSTVASTFIAHSIFVIALFMCLLITTIGIALWLGDVFGKIYYGFFCVALFYGLLGVLLYLVRNKIKRRVGDSIISNILDK